MNKLCMTSDNCCRQMEPVSIVLFILLNSLIIAEKCSVVLELLMF